MILDSLIIVDMIDIRLDMIIVLVKHQQSYDYTTSNIQHFGIIIVIYIAYCIIVSNFVFKFSGNFFEICAIWICE